MIVSASRRTDIPAFFGEWFINRLEAGFFVNVNPFNPSQRKKISLARKDVDCFVFWSKNPRPFFRYLKMTEDYPSYFHFTLNSYPKFIEPHIPTYKERIDTFITLSQMTDPKRVILRYDPVIISEKTNYNYHLEMIERTLSDLKGHTKRMITSFVTHYRKLSRKFADLKNDHSFAIGKPEEPSLGIFVNKLRLLGEKYKVDVVSCCDSNLSCFGIEKGACIDGDLINNITGAEKSFKRDSGQREGCMCVKSVDMGVYNTCSFGCAYCYASLKRETVLRNLSRYSPLTDSLLP